MFMDEMILFLGFASIIGGEREVAVRTAETQDW